MIYFRLWGQGYGDCLMMSMMGLGEGWEGTYDMLLSSLIKQGNFKLDLLQAARPEKLFIFLVMFLVSVCLLLTRVQWSRASPHLQGVSCRIRICKISHRIKAKQVLAIVFPLEIILLLEGHGVGLQGKNVEDQTSGVDCNKAQSVKRN